MKKLALIPLLRNLEKEKFIWSLQLRPKGKLSKCLELIEQKVTRPDLLKQPDILSKINEK